MGRLLIDDYPLVFSPRLAMAVGLNEAIVLQQLHYWLGKSQHEFEGRMWVYNTYDQWQEQFPFWTTRTVQNIILRMERERLIDTTDSHNQDVRDRTKWYTINYEHPILDAQDENFSSSRARKVFVVDDENFSSSTLDRDYVPETSTETSPDRPIQSEDDAFTQFYAEYPRKEAKRDARKAWGQVYKPSVRWWTQVISALEQQKEHKWKGKDKQFIPLPASWLRGERWNDEIPSHRPVIAGRDDERSWLDTYTED